jgi:hypothetical protein
MFAPSMQTYAHDEHVYAQVLHTCAVLLYNRAQVLHMYVEALHCCSFIVLSCAIHAIPLHKVYTACAQVCSTCTYLLTCADLP